MGLHDGLRLRDRVAENELRHAHVGIGGRLVEQSADFLIAADVQARVFGKAGHGRLLEIQCLLCAVCAHNVKLACRTSDQRGQGQLNGPLKQKDTYFVCPLHRALAALTACNIVHTIIVMEISYNPAKNARNIAERGLSFDRVVDFDFETAKIREDVRKTYPEQRFIAVGWLDARLHVLCFSPAAGGIRVISFRKANSREQRIYDQRT